MPSLNQNGAGPARVRSSLAATEWRYDGLILTLCLVLVYWLGFGDFLIKFLPESTGLVLRFVPEVLLYGLGAATCLRCAGDGDRWFQIGRAHV